MHLPDYVELLEGCAAYIDQEKRDAMYKVALRLVSESQWKPDDLADAVGVLLLTWNAAFYTKRGSFNFEHLELFIEKRACELRKFSKRSIMSYCEDDDKIVQQLFEELMGAVESDRNRIKTPVGTAKALHILYARALFGTMRLPRSTKFTGLKEESILLSYMQSSNT